MSYQVNGNYKAANNAAVSYPSKKEVETLAQMYTEAINRADMQGRMWDDIQRETDSAIYAQLKKGEISEKVATVRTLMNEALAQKAYARCAEQQDIAKCKLNALKQHCPEYFKK